MKWRHTYRQSILVGAGTDPADPLAVRFKDKLVEPVSDLAQTTLNADDVAVEVFQSGLAVTLDPRQLVDQISQAFDKQSQVRRHVVPGDLNLTPTRLYA